MNSSSELVQDSLTESKTSHFSPFFTFFQLRSSGYVPSKMQKLTKISLFLPPAENPEQALTFPVSPIANNL
jgi:hypothetical protein